MTKEEEVGMIIFFSCLKKSVPIRAWKCNFSFCFKKLWQGGRQTNHTTDWPTNQQMDPKVHRELSITEKKSEQKLWEPNSYS